MVLGKSANELDGSEHRDTAIPLLVEETAGRILALGRRLCRSREEAEDLVQETFLQAYRKWDQFEGRAKATTWLFTIATRLCQRMHRKREGEPDSLESLESLLPFGEDEMGVVPQASSGLDHEIRRESREQIEQAIAELPADFRIPLVLKELAGMSLDEVAEVMEINPATIKTRLHRARLRIRKALEDVLPRKNVPQAIFSRQICLDLLHAKQESLDLNSTFEFPDQVVCDRCSELFSTLDLSQEICRELSAGELPEALRALVMAGIEAEKR
jgi:RNA polymerase sigma-70 factor (ECF subfamily)